MDRAERRRIKKMVSKRTRIVVNAGLPDDPEPADVAAVALEILKALKNRKNLSRASLAGRLAGLVLKRSILASASDVPIECQKGCAACCHVFTSASAPEIFSIAQEIRKNRTDSEIEKLLDRSKQVIGVGLDERFLSRLPCPLLEGGSCTVYEQRPISCRKLASVSAAACDSAFEGSDEDVPYSMKHWAFGDFVRMALHGSIRAVGLSPGGYELAEGLSIALTTPAAEQRWLAGEDVFFGCQLDPDSDVDLVTASEAISELIK